MALVNWFSIVRKQFELVKDVYALGGFDNVPEARFCELFLRSMLRAVIERPDHGLVDLTHRLFIASVLDECQLDHAEIREIEGGWSGPSPTHRELEVLLVSLVAHLKTERASRMSRTGSISKADEFGTHASKIAHTKADSAVKTAPSLSARLERERSKHLTDNDLKSESPASTSHPFKVSQSKAELTVKT